MKTFPPVIRANDPGHYHQKIPYGSHNTATRDRQNPNLGHHPKDRGNTRKIHLLRAMHTTTETTRGSIFHRPMIVLDSTITKAISTIETTCAIPIHHLEELAILLSEVGTATPIVMHRIEIGFKRITSLGSSSSTEGKNEMRLTTGPMIEASLGPMIMVGIHQH